MVLQVKITCKLTVVPQAAQGSPRFVKANNLIPFFTDTTVVRVRTWRLSMKAAGIGFLRRNLETRFQVFLRSENHRHSKFLVRLKGLKFKIMYGFKQTRGTNRRFGV